jgi:hypothetical protein
VKPKHIYPHTSAVAVQNRVQEAEDTERNINVARESYRSGATRGSILYFCIADLAGINPMYQFSLSYFIRMFVKCIKDSGKSADVPTRLLLLNKFVTSFLFKNVSRWVLSCFFSTLRTIFLHAAAVAEFVDLWQDESRDSTSCLTFYA